MSTKLGTLTLDLVAKISNFVEPINQAEKKTKSLSQAIAENFNVSTLAVNALGAAFSGVTVGGLAAFTNQVISTGNEIKKLSQLSNASTFDFQFYAKGAETVGISMDSFAQQMKDMQDGIGDFQQTGGGPLADFFANIAPLVGVTIDQFQKLSGPDALQLFYSSLEKVGATKNDIKFYMESIISDSSLLIPLLENGGEGFEKWGQAASDAGAIMSDELIGELALAKENIQLLNLEFEGMQVSLINGFTPVIQTVANNLDVVAVSVGALAAVMTVKAAPAFIADTALKVSNTIATRQKAVADYEIAKSNLAATVAMVRAMGVANAQTAAMITNANAAYKQAAATRTAALASTSMIGILGGPVGLALTVATVAGSYLLFRDNTDKSTISLRENNETVEQAINKYTELGEAKRNSQLAKEREELSKLSEEYDNLKDKLITASYSLSRHNDMTTEQSKTVNTLIAEFKKTGDVDLFSRKIKELGFVNQDSEDKISKLAGAVSNASDEVKEHKNLVTQMIEKDKQLIKINDDVTSSIDRRGAALFKLTQKEKEVYQSIEQELQRESYINANVSQGFMSRDKAEYFADKRAEAGIPYSKLLTKEMYLQFEQGYKLQQQIEQRQETEKKLTEEKRKQLEIAEKTVKSQTIDSVIARGEGNYNSVNLGQKYGYKSSTRNLKAMTVGEVLAAQARKEFNTAGKYQTISSTLRGAVDAGIVSTAEKFNEEVQERIVQNYLLTAKKGRKSLEDYISGKGNDLVGANIDVAKEFAAVAHPATGKSYYDGVGNNRASISVKEAQDALMASRALYAQAIASGKSDEEAWKSAFNGSFTFVKDSDTQKALEVVLEAQNKAEEIKKESLERQKNVDRLYLSENERSLVEHEDAKKEIQEAYLGDATAIEKYVSIQNKIYAEAQKLADMQFAWELSEHRLTEEQKLRYSYNIKEQEIQASTQLTIDQKNLKLKALKEQFSQEFGMFEIAQNKQLLEMQRNWMTAGEYARQYYALVRQEILNTPSYSPEMKHGLVKEANFNQGMEENSEREQVWADYQSRFGSGTNEYQLDHDLLKEALDQKLITEQEYFNKRAVLHAEWGQNYFAGTADVLRSVLGEESGFYQAAFAMQKAYAVAKVALNAPETYSNVYATVSALPVVGPYLAPVMAGAAVALQMAQAATLGSVTLSGMAHDGIDNVPKEGTWLLDKGERVVDSRTNADLKGYLQDARSQNGGGANIVINVPPGYVAQRSQQGDREVIDIVERYIGQQIQNPNSNLMKGITKKTTATVRR